MRIFLQRGGGGGGSPFLKKLCPHVACSDYNRFGLSTRKRKNRGNMIARPSLVLDCDILTVMIHQLY